MSFSVIPDKLLTTDELHSQIFSIRNGDVNKEGFSQDKDGESWHFILTERACWRRWNKLFKKLCAFPRSSLDLLRRRHSKSVLPTVSTSNPYPLCTRGRRVTQGCPSASAASSRSGRSRETCACKQWAPPRWRGWEGRRPRRCQWWLCCWAGCRTWCGPRRGKTRCHPHVPCEGEREGDRCYK